MYERMKTKEIQPEISEIREYVGEKSWALIQDFEAFLKDKYDLNRELCFPFGNSYGWGFKYSHKTKHLCHLFFEKDAATVTLQIGDKETPALNEIFPTLSENAKSLWEKRYPCGDVGGWIHFRMLTTDDLEDISKLIQVKKKPPRKRESSQQ